VKTVDVRSGETGKVLLFIEKHDITKHLDSFVIDVNHRVQNWLDKIYKKNLSETKIHKEIITKDASRNDINRELSMLAKSDVVAKAVSDPNMGFFNNLLCKRI